MLLTFWKFGFFNGDSGVDSALQVQDVSQKSIRLKWTQLDQLDNRSYSTIKPRPTYPTYIMKIGGWPTILEFFDNLSQKLIQTTQQNSHQTCNEVKRPPCDPF